MNIIAMDLKLVAHVNENYAAGEMYRWVWALPNHSFFELVRINHPQEKDLYVWQITFKSSRSSMSQMAFKPINFIEHMHIISTHNSDTLFTEVGKPFAVNHYQNIRSLFSSQDDDDFYKVDYFYIRSIQTTYRG